MPFVNLEGYTLETEGYVEKIRFRNEENGYTVLSLVKEGEDEVTCVGVFPTIGEGEYIVVQGELVTHSSYGEQIKVSSYAQRPPKAPIAMERYLGSGAIKGIGPALAHRIVEKFGEDTFRIMEEEPECLSKVKGISEKKAREIAVQFSEKKQMRDAMIYLSGFGISNRLSVKIYQKYGLKLYEILKENPYRLADDIEGIGFKLADEIARKAGIQADSEFRIESAVYYVLMQAGGQGHVYLPVDALYQRSCELLGVEIASFDFYLKELGMQKRVVVKKVEEEYAVYASVYYYMELGCARMLEDLSLSYEVKEQTEKRRMEKFRENSEIILDEMQELAVKKAMGSGLMILTGGPGTGKTTTINAIIQIFEAEGMEILLAAPTGRAAKRMSETTGYEAQTIHRLLEFSKGGVLDSEREYERHPGRTVFERNESNPLETDVIIIDEMSMVDIYLFYALLKAIPIGCRVIFVGDVNQLPSVGPGNVLRDMIDSECFPVVKLTHIFRQAAQSDIIVNAHLINEGKMPVLDNKSRDFFFLEREEVIKIQNVMLELVLKKLPKYVNATPFDIQVLTPQRKGELGVERLNEILQHFLNPPSEDKEEKEMAHGVFRMGDKVMQTKNNYQLAWEQYGYGHVAFAKGAGVFNGDMGIIREINPFTRTITVEFEEGKEVVYGEADAEELELAYAITIHKSQGSEYPAVVMPLLSGTSMLFHRNLLYTGVTRGKKCVTIVGRRRMVEQMVSNVNEQKRYSSLALRIQESFHENK